MHTSQKKLERCLAYKIDKHALKSPSSSIVDVWKELQEVTSTKLIWVYPLPYF